MNHEPIDAAPDNPDMTLPAADAVAAASETGAVGGSEVALPDSILQALIIREPEPLQGGQLALWNALERLERTLDSETSELVTLKVADYSRLNEAKSRILLDVSRAVRAVEGQETDPRLQARLSVMRLKLEHNQLAIAMHLDAVREIAHAMTTALIEAESDGTYSARVSAQVAAHADTRPGRRPGANGR